MEAIQRLRQGIRALLAFSTPLDNALTAQYLSPAEMKLFMALSRPEQLHSLNVLRSVLAQSPETPADLAVVALLHDCGKARCRLAVWQKTLAVLVKTFLPALERRLSATDTLTFWRAPFVVRRYHPAWGAQMLAEAGAGERVIWLAGHHADPLSDWPNHPHAPLLQRLKHADDLN